MAGLSVPFVPQGDVPPSTRWPVSGDLEFYMRHFQRPGVAEVAFDSNVKRAIGGFLWLLSGERPRKGLPIAGMPAETMVPRESGFGPALPAAMARPAWLTEKDLDVYVAEFKRTGFRGGLNWYRNIDRNWELGRPYKNALLGVPALFMAGDQDVVPELPGLDQIVATLPQIVPTLKDSIILQGCGHWTQQERPREVSEALIAFARSVFA